MTAEIDTTTSIANRSTRRGNRGGNLTIGDARPRLRPRDGNGNPLPQGRVRTKETQELADAVRQMLAPQENKGNEKNAIETPVQKSISERKTRRGRSVKVKPTLNPLTEKVEKRFQDPSVAQRVIGAGSAKAAGEGIGGRRTRRKGRTQMLQPGIKEAKAGDIPKSEQNHQSSVIPPRYLRMDLILKIQTPTSEVLSLTLEATLDREEKKLEAFGRYTGQDFMLIANVMPNGIIDNKSISASRLDGAPLDLSSFKILDFGFQDKENAFGSVKVEDVLARAADEVVLATEPQLGSQTEVQPVPVAVRWEIERAQKEAVECLQEQLNRINNDGLKMFKGSKRTSRKCDALSNTMKVISASEFSSINDIKSLIESLDNNSEVTANRSFFRKANSTNKSTTKLALEKLIGSLKTAHNVLQEACGEQTQVASSTPAATS